MIVTFSAIAFFYYSDKDHTVDLKSDELLKESENFLLEIYSLEKSLSNKISSDKLKNKKENKIKNFRIKKSKQLSEKVFRKPANKLYKVKLKRKSKKNFKRAKQKNQTITNEFNLFINVRNRQEILSDNLNNGGTINGQMDKELFIRWKTIFSEKYYLSLGAGIEKQSVNNTKTNRIQNTEFILENFSYSAGMILNKSHDLSLSFLMRERLFARALDETRIELFKYSLKELQFKYQYHALDNKTIKLSPEIYYNQGLTDNFIRSNNTIGAGLSLEYKLNQNHSIGNKLFYERNNIKNSFYDGEMTIMGFGVSYGLSW